MNETFIEAPIETREANPALGKLARAFATPDAVFQETSINPETEKVQDQVEKQVVEHKGRTVQDVADKMSGIVKYAQDTAGKGLINKIIADVINLAAIGLAPLTEVIKVGEIFSEKTVLANAHSEARDKYLDLGTMLEAWKRNEVDQNYLTTKLIELGYTDTDIEVLIKLTTKHLSAGDILSIASKNVFDDKNTALFRLDKNLSNLEHVIRPRIEQTGTTWEDFSLLWKAHWNLPSLSDLILLLQRGQLDKDVVQAVLETSNIAPTFVPKIMNVLFQPLSKADVRRLYNDDIIGSHTILVNRYEKMGYAPDDAELLALWVESNKPRKSQAPNELRNLNKGDILSNYKDRLISKNEAKTTLVSIGYASDEVEYYIAHADYEIARDQISVLTDTLKKAYQNGFITNSYVRTTMSKLNLPSEYIESLLNLWDIETNIPTQRPTKSEILSWYSTGHINRENAYGELQMLGYADKYIELYLAVNEQKKSITKK